MDAYGNNKSASAALEDGGGDGGSGDIPEKQSGDKGYNCFLPADFPGAENLKSGDTISLRVVGKDKDGDIECEHVSEPSSGGGGDQPIMDDFDKSMS